MLTNLDVQSSPVSHAEEITLPLPAMQRRVESRQPAPPSSAQRVYLPIRRGLDLALTLVIGILAAPVILLAAVLIRLTSRGPAFYTQVRIGRDGRPFTIYKLRSMIHDCESLTGPRWTIPGDPRVTPVGWLLRRTHIDELPQLLNVLMGEMSLVGPRPERPEFVMELEQALPDYQRRHAVLPGITGLAQVQLAPDTDLESVRRKLEHDLHFVAHLGFGLDCRIMLATVLHMFGVSFRWLRKLRVVPSPASRAGSQAPLPTEATPLVRQQAA